MTREFLLPVPTMRNVSLWILLATAPAAMGQNPAYLQYQFNEPRGTAIANTGGVGPAFATVAREGWQADAPPHFGPPDLGIGALGVDSTSPYENVVQTGWPLHLPSGSFTITWRQRLVAAPAPGAQAFAWGSGQTFSCFTGGSAGNGLCLRTAQFGDLCTNIDFRQTNWHFVVVAVDNSAREIRWYLNYFTTAYTPFPTPTGTLNPVEGTGFRIGAHGSASDVYTRYYEMDDFRIYNRAFYGHDVFEELGSETPRASSFGAPCAPSGAAAPSLSLSGQPDLNTFRTTRITLQARGLPPQAPAVLVLGLSAVSVGGSPLLLLDLSSALGLECTLGVAPDVVMPISVVAGGYDLAFDVGGRGSTVPYGLHLYAQVLVLRPGNGSATAVLDINFQPTA